MKQYHDNYGYNLEKTIQQLPVRLENDEAKEALIKTLHKGNIAMATFSEKGKERKVHLEAAPQFKNIVIYDEHMKREFQQHKEQSISQAREQKREIIPEKHQEKKQQEVLQVENKRSKGRSQSR